MGKSSRDNEDGGEEHKKAKRDNESLRKVDDWSYSTIHYCAEAVTDEEFRAGMKAVFDSIGVKGENLMRRAILVRGVHLGSSKQPLLDHFTTYGPINECILVINAAGKGLSLALLIFKTQAGALAAVDKPTKFVNGSLTHSQFVVAGGCYPPQKIHPAGTEVYVSNLLPNHPSLHTLREEFLNYGDIDFGPARHAMPPGFVYIIYATPEGANAATQQPSKIVAGRPLFCSSTRDEVLKAARENVKGILDKYRTEALAAFSKPHPANTTVYITHVNRDCDSNKLKDLFAEFGEIVAGPIKVDAKRNVCLVIYKTEEGKKMALQDPWKLINGHKIHCSSDTLAIEQEAEKLVRITVEAAIGMVELRQHQYDISVAQRKAKALENQDSRPDAIILDNEDGGEEHKKAKRDNESLRKVDDWSFSTIHYCAEAVTDEEFRAGMKAVFDSSGEKGENLMRRAILVRGVHLGSSKQSLLDHFTTYGPINECILVINAAGKGMSLALLIFKTQAGALAAVDKPTKFVNGSLTHSQFVVAGGCYPPQKIHPAGTEVYVSNLLPNHPSLHTLREEFLNYGDIHFGPARYAMPPGFVYIIYATPEEANAATQQPSKTVAGRPLFCSSTRDEVLKAARENAKGILDKYRTEALAAFSKPHPANTTVYISHINCECDPHKLKDLFAEFGEIFAGPTKIDAKWNVCLIVYKTDESKKMALQEPWKLFDGHKIHCSADTLAIEQEVEKLVRITVEATSGLVELRQHQYDVSVAQRKAKALENQNSRPDM